MGKFLTTAEAGDRLGIKQSRVRQLLLSGKLKATKFGTAWMIDEDDLESVKERKRTGRPRKNNDNG